MSNKDKKIDELNVKKKIPQKFTSAARNNYFIKNSSIEREKTALRLYKKSQLHIPISRV